jgi:hypothetical protein
MKTTWIPTTDYEHVVDERGGGSEEAERPRLRATRPETNRVCEQRRGPTATTTDTAGQTKPFNVIAEPEPLCCGRRQATWAGRPLKLGCQLCSDSPTYWRRGT